jgi:hypothetical protein
MAAPKTSAYKLELNVSNILKNLLLVKESLKSVDKVFEKGLTVKINANQFQALKSTLQKLGSDMTASFESGTANIADVLKVIVNKFQLIPEEAAKAGLRAGEALSGNFVAGLEGLDSRLGAQVSNTIHNMEARLQKMSATAKAAFAQTAAAGRMNPAYLVTMDDSETPKPFQNPDRVGNINRTMAAIERADALATSIGAKVNAAHELALKLKADEATADAKTFSGQIAASQDLSAVRAKAHETRIAEIYTELEAEKKTFAGQFAASQELTAVRTKAHEADIARIYAELDAENKKFAGQFTASQDLTAQREKAHEADIARIYAELDAENKKFAGQISASQELTAARTKAHEADIARIYKELEAEEKRAAAKIATEKESNNVQAKAIDMIRKEGIASADAIKKAEIEYKKLLDLATKLRSTALLPPGGAQSLLKPAVLPGGGSYGNVAYDSTEASALRQRITSQKSLNTLAGDHLKTQNSIGSSLSNGILLAAKYLVMFRALHEVARLIEGAISGFVKAGIEYNAVAETQKLALSVSLNESMKISAVQSDGTTKQLHGLTAINALQAESEKQWRELQASSLAVVGTTADLMGIYIALLPVSSRLGASTDDLQKLVRSTAIAAGLLAIPFDMARTAILSLLNGRSLTKNRLVASLGLDEAEVRRLKGTPELFKMVSTALAGYDLVAGRATKTFAALRETMGEMIGIMAGGVVAPFTAMFADAVQKIQNIFFTLQGGAMKPTPETTAFFHVVQSAVKDVVAELMHFGSTIKEQGADKLLLYVLAFKRAIEVIASFVKWMVTATLTVSEFIANNSRLLGLISKGLLIFAAYAMVANATNKVMAVLGLTIQATGIQVKALGTALPVAAAEMDIFTAAEARTGVMANVAKSAFMGLRTVMMTLFTATVIGAIIYGITKLVEHFTTLADRADDAAEAMRKANEGDYAGAQGAQAKQLNDPDPSVRSKAQRQRYGGDLTSAINDQQKLLNGKTYRAYLDEIIAAERRLEDERTTASAKRQEQIAVDLLGLSNQKKAIHASTDAIADLSSHTTELTRTEADLRKLAKEQSATIQSTKGTGLVDDTATMRIAAEQELRDTINQANAIRDDNSKLAAAKALVAQQLKDQAAAEALLITPQKTEPKEGFTKSFHSAGEDELKALTDRLALETAVIKSDEDAHVINHKEASDKLLAIDEERYTETLRLLQFIQHEHEVEDAYLKSKGKGDANTNASIDEKAVNTKRESDYAIQQAKNAKVAADHIRGNDDKIYADAVEKLKTSSQDEIDGMLDGVFGKYSEKVGAQIKALADKIRAEFTAKGEAALGDKFAKQLTDAIPAAEMIKAAARAVADYDHVIQDLQRSQGALDMRFQNGAMSVSEYTAATVKNTTAQIANLRAKAASLETEIAGSVAQHTDPQAIAAMRSELDATNLQLEALTSWANKAVKAFDALHQSLSAVQALGAIFDPSKGWGDGLTKSLGVVNGLVGSLQNLKEAISAVKQAMAAMQAMKSSNGGGGIAGFFSQFSGLASHAGGGGGVGAMGDWGGEAGNAASAGGGAGLATSAILGVTTMGVSVAIQVGMMLFQRAVEKAKKVVEDNVKSISKALANGSITIGQAQDQLQQARANAIARYSDSKSGRKALKEILPDLDQQIAEMAKQITDLRKSFQDKLKDARLGTGPNADFARMLIDLKVTAQAYLDTFKKGSDEYLAALKDVTELYKLTLQKAKADLVSQMSGFNEEALNSAIAVLDMLQQQADAYENLADLEQQRQDLVQAQLDLNDENKKAIDDLAKKRKDNAEAILKIEQQILDVIKKAKEDEEAIRRRGILEAQETIAQQKAREINNVRNDAQKQIDDLKKQLDDLNKSAEFAQDEKDLKRKQSDAQKALDKQAKSLDKQIKQQHEALDLLEVRLVTAEAIAAIEGTMFDTTGNRLELERKIGALQIAQAGVKVKMWQEVQALIDAIDDSGVFTPPPGFPQINVTIGDIVINNTGLPNDTGTELPPTNTGPSGPAVPHGPGDGPDPQPPRQPKPFLRAAFSDFERQFLR